MSRIRWQAHSISLALLAALSACATAGTHPRRADYGHVRVIVDKPLIATQVIDEFEFHIQDRRITESAPGSSLGFDYSLQKDGCLRGPSLQEYCKAPLLDDDPRDVTRWRATAGTATFTVRLTPDGNALVVEAFWSRGIYALGPGESIDEIRREPWMLGVAFAHGVEPKAASNGDGSWRDFNYHVVESQ